MIKRLSQAMKGCFGDVKFGLISYYFDSDKILIFFCKIHKI